MKLTKKQRDDLWGEDGPYSQVQLIVETRILDDRVSRVFVNVEAQINPLTIDIITQNRREFLDDEKIQQLLDHAQYQMDDRGYVVGSFSEEYLGQKTLIAAQSAVERTKATLIKMHKFVMSLLGIRGQG